MCMRCNAMALTVLFAGLLVTLTPRLVAAAPWELCSNTTGNYTANSTYGANLRRAAATLPSNASASPARFAAATIGTAPNVVHTVGQCRGDQDAAACHDCIAACFANAQTLCPHNKGAAIFYDNCLLGFSSRDFLASPTNLDGQEIRLSNPADVAACIATRFDASANRLLDAMTEYLTTSTNSSSMRFFVTGAIRFDSTYPNIYGVASCTPDLTSRQCRACLNETIAEMPRVFRPNTKGARIAGMRCTVRYEVYHLFNGSAMVQLPGFQAAGVCLLLVMFYQFILPQKNLCYYLFTTFSETCGICAQ